jgi:excisionase family DNA binding protein
VDTEHEWLKVPEVAQLPRIERSRAYELVGSGEIRSVSIGRSVRVSREELDRWLEEERQAKARWRYSKRSMVASWCRSWSGSGKGAVAYEFGMDTGHEPTQHSVDRRRPRGGAERQADLLSPR